MRVVLEAELSGADAALYDAFVDDAAGAHFSQTRAWAPLATAGRALESFYFLACDGDDVIAAARLLRPKLGIFKAPLVAIERGPVCRAPADLAQVLLRLRRALRARGVAHVTVMPYFAGPEKIAAEKILADRGFRNVQTPSGAHVRTLRLDLRGKHAEQIFTGGDRQALRRKLKQAEKAGVQVRLGSCTDVAQLERLHAEMMGAQGKPKKSSAYFSALADLLKRSNRGALVVAEHEAQVVAALFVMAHGPLVTFVVGASTPRALPFSKMASAMAHAIRWAHSRGAGAFDLGGIPAQDDADAKRASIAQFKFDFTKTAIDLAAEHARWF